MLTKVVLSTAQHSSTSYKSAREVELHAYKAGFDTPSHSVESEEKSRIIVPKKKSQWRSQGDASVEIARHPHFGQLEGRVHIRLKLSSICTCN